MKRLLTRAGSVLLAVVAILAALAAPAAAHPALVSSDPVAGYALEDAPAQVLLRFSEPVQPAARPLRLVRDDGTAVRLLVTQEDGGAVLRGAVDEELDTGRYAARYDVVASDGDVVRGEVAFTVGLPAATGAAAARAAAPGVAPDLALPRALLFAGLAVALGGLVAAWDARRVTGGRSTVRPLVRSGALGGAAGAAGSLLVVADGDAARVRELLAGGGPARLLLGEALLLLLVAASPQRSALGRLPALLTVAVFEGLRAHPGKVGGTTGTALTVVHLLAASVWLGGLLHVLRIGVRHRGEQVARLAVTSYARTALVLALVVVLTGTASGLLLLPTLSDVVDTAYGRALLVKLSLVTLALLAAGLARVLLRRRAGPPLGRAARFEAAVLAAVLLASGALTSATPARLVPAGAATLAAPTGPVLRIAERAQQVTVAAALSEGRLDLRADVPDDGRPVSYDLTVTVTAPDGTVSRPTVRSCGGACWTAEVAWATGRNDVAIDLTADPWQAGRVVLPAVWPPTPAPELLDRVRAAMAAAPVVETFETVTSGFGVDVPSTSTGSGQEYLREQSWAAGGATDVALVREGERRTLLLALPALGYHYRLDLDERDRVVAERIVTPNHVLTRQHRYPPA